MRSDSAPSSARLTVLARSGVKFFVTESTSSLYTARVTSSAVLDSLEPQPARARTAQPQTTSALIVVICLDRPPAVAGHRDLLLAADRSRMHHRRLRDEVRRLSGRAVRLQHRDL